MSGAPEAVGTLEIALGRAAQLLASDPALAIEQANEILKVVPGQAAATLILGAANRAAGKLTMALAVLEPLSRAHPAWAGAHYERALALGLVGERDRAIAALRRAVELKPGHGDAWRALGDLLVTSGDSAGADAAYANHIRAATRDPRLLEPAAALGEGKIAVAEALLRAHLKQHPTDVAAIRMLAEVAARLGRFGDSETLLLRCLELAPGFHAARHNYAVVLHRQNRPADALREVDRLLEGDPGNAGARNLKAAILARIGEVQQSAEIYGRILEEHPGHPKIWQSYGHSLKTAGRQAGVHCRLPTQHRAGACLRRGLLEPRQPEDVQVLGRRHAGDARPAGR